MEGFDWDQLLVMFRGLGGMAENVCQGEGPLGRGIFPVHSGLRSTIVVPERLLVPVKEIGLEGGAVTLKPSSPFGAEFKQFFELYQAHFSWGQGGSLVIDAFERSLSQLPDSVLQMLARHQLVDLPARHRGSWDQTVFARFLASRQVPFRGKPVIAPVWELVNHDVASPPFQLLPDGLATPTMPPSDAEVTFKYSESSPLFRLFNYGFTCQEATVFSFPFQLAVQGGGLSIQCQGLSLKDDRINLTQANGVILISGLPIGNRNVPEQPYAYLGEVLRRLGAGQQAQSLFETIQQFNSKQRQDLLRSLQDCHGLAADSIKAAVAFELELIASSGF